MLFVLCGVIDAVISIIYFTAAEHGFHAASALVFLGTLTLAVGACMIATGIWSSRNSKYWLLLNGLACSALGLILAFWTGPLSFRTVALLIAVMALSIGAYELAIVRTWRVIAGDWLFGAASVVSVGFALAFLAFVFRWITLEPASPGESLRWLGVFFGFCAISTLGLTLRRYSPFVQAGSAPSAL
ncbi:MAG: hypothetical protein WA324_29920 [Bryobacteraceae bacterium]